MEKLHIKWYNNNLIDDTILHMETEKQRYTKIRISPSSEILGITCINGNAKELLIKNS